jgi:diguanylate cyclase (GGDEF)-like protein/PAS domain S-box-containing protein
MLENLWRRLTDPRGVMPEPERRRARLLSGVLLLLLLLIAFPVVLRSLLDPAYPRQNPTFLVTVGVAVTLATAYSLNRAGRVRAAMFLTVAVVALAIWAIVIANHDDAGIILAILPYMVVSVLLSSLLFSVQATLLLALAHLAVSLSLLVLDPHLVSPELVNTLLFIGIVTFFIVAATVLRQQDLKQIERQAQALAESQARFRSAFDSAAIGIALVGPDGRWLQVNRALCELVGYSESELLATTFQAITHPDDLEADLNLVRQLLAGEIRSYHMEKRYFHKQGHVVWILLSVSLVRDAQEKPLYFISQIQDTTARKQAAEALREAEVRYRSLFEGVPVGLYRTTPAGQILDANAALILMLGYPDLETYRNVSAVNLYVNPAVRREWQSLIDRQEVVRDFEVQARRSDGTVIWARDSARAVRDPNGQVLYYDGIFEDITERKRREEALRESELRFWNLFEHSPDAIFVEDFEGKVLDANAAACHLNGMAYADLVGTNVLELIPADKREGAARDFSKMVKGELEYVEGFSQTKEGRVVPVEIRVSRITYSDKPALLLQVRDITTRKRAEAALQEAEGKYRALVEQLPAITYVVDFGERNRTIYISPQVEALLGFSPAEWLGDPELWIKRLHPDDRERVMAEVQRRDASGESVSLEYRFLARDGSVLWVRNQNVLIRDEAGQIRHAHGVMFDITERMLTEEALQTANEKLILGMAELELRSHEIALLNQMGDLLQTCLNVEEAYSIIGQSARQLFPEEAGALYMISASRDVVEAVAVWGHSPFGSAQDKPAEVLECVFAPQDCWALRRSRPHLVEDTGTGPLCRHLTSPPPATYVCIPMMAQSEATGVLYLQDRGGSLPPAKLQLAQTVADSVALALANLKLRETLRHQSIRDPLTGLFNRRYMEETLERETRRVARAQRPLGIIMLDVDHFKLFNDTFGHDAGDALLREFGNFLRAHVRGEDVACRYGGEEFTLILPEASLEVTRQRAEHLRGDIKHLHAQYHDQPLGAVALSLGVAVFPDHGSTGEAVLKAADAALYRAKREGRDRVVVAG